MAYTAKNASDTLFGYLNISEQSVRFIENTSERGFVFEDLNGEKSVIFIYPISHKADDTKNFFDTRDSGAYERGVAWNYALHNKLKYFCFAVHNQVEKYNNYIFSLESQEKIIEKVSGTLNGSRVGTGTQVVIPNDYIPDGQFERILTKNGFFMAVVHKHSILDYIKMFDNRPYLIDDTPVDLDEQEIITDDSLQPIEFSTGFKSTFQRNRIVFGAPGTGKSFNLKNDSEDLLRDTTGTYERVTFHPDYTYSHFVGTYKPVTDAAGGIRYEFVPGPFMRVFVEALKSGRTENPQPHLLLIEEINRAKVAAVFGDVFQLLDRDDDGVSEYEIHATEDIRNHLAKELGGVPNDYDRIRIPDNMFIWATMNSADQGVYPMDTAFKRRWHFEYLGIDNRSDLIQGRITLGTGSHEIEVDCNQLRKAINEKLAKDYKINEDKLLGPFFLSKKVLKTNEVDGKISDPEKFIDAFKSKVIMYLYEDAAKQYKYKLFDGCDSSKYSSVCDAFDDIGIDIFGNGFRELYEKQGV